MFTGIVTDIGEVLSATQGGDLRLRISCYYDISDIETGASIATDGICLTVIATGHTPEGTGWYEAEVSAETAARTTIGHPGASAGWVPGRKLNLERALRVGDELGGHIVSGHVDDVAEVLSLRPDGDSTRVTLRAPEALARYIAHKGSVALNGVSLTVNEVSGREFGVNVIPHTREATTWQYVMAGDTVNLEIDTLARYVARLEEWKA